MTATERKLEILEDVARLRRVERVLPENRDLTAVLSRLEGELGRSVSQRLAAKAIGVSHTALQRWIASGDVPTIYTPEGRREIPISTVLDLADSVAGAKAEAKRASHFLEPVLQENRARAKRLRDRPLSRGTASRTRDEGHDNASARDLVFHEAVARGLNRETVRAARSRLWRLRQDGRIHPRYAEQWGDALGGTIAEIKNAMVADTEAGRDLRQNSPFAGALSEVERREALRQAAD